MSLSLTRLFEGATSLAKGKRPAGGQSISLTQLQGLFQRAPPVLKIKLHIRGDLLRQHVRECGVAYGFASALGDENDCLSRSGSRRGSQLSRYTLDMAVGLAWQTLARCVDEFLTESLDDLSIVVPTHAHRGRTAVAFSVESWVDASRWIASGLRRGDDWLAA